ncbi:MULTISPECIES: fluoride efflux transporter CrcB [unclassified Symbiopectobacterium]|uniref:fluoride efflux transporter CrcB n=1 Tax=unclassified Symbiopectobacterium TaxID=2794573 RepID=UPI002226E48D|nr:MULTISPECIES: fluoride efflux transporter CrcB [unclassified Symbiopectobacterium]MCW2474613.1 fluoride efflux transporter CrcB [Candidatus Symbiopectobacterium sp. NZEC151]MCW2487620.1 fluoride efflux transporter CrcB [Candidatus Symbiopectobacterium sp. NZEC127]
MWMMFLAVFIGGGAGSVARWALGMRYNTTAVSVLPLGTLMANLIGAFVIGGALAYFSRHAELPSHWKLLITTGLCGGLTTFSTFSAETFLFINQGQLSAAAINILCNLAGSLLMTALAFALVNGMAS